MSKFKPQSAYNNQTPQQPSPTSEAVAATTPTDSPSPSSIPVTASAAEPEIKVAFLIDSVDGEFPLEQSGTTAVIEEIFRRYATEGITLHNQRGFVWYNPSFIKKITVKF